MDMLNSFIGFFSVTFVAFYVFFKGINEQPKRKEVTRYCLYTVGICIAVLGVRFIFPPAAPFVLVFLSVIPNRRFMSYLGREAFRISFTATVISCGLSYGFSTVAVFIVSIFTGIFQANNIYSIFIDDTAALLYSFCIQCALLVSLFKIRRLKTGYSFLNLRNINRILIFLSLTVFSCYAVVARLKPLISSDEPSIIISAIMGLVTVLCALMIIIWWRAGIKLIYNDNLVKQEAEALKLRIRLQEKEIGKLNKENQLFSEIIHRDNKLLPSMEHAVTTFLEASKESSPELAEEAEAILKALKTYTQGRRGVLNQYVKEAKSLPSTKILTIDMILNYINQEAIAGNIEFDVVINGNIKYMVENIISEESLETLVADLLDNAINALKPFKVGKILFSIGVVDDYYEISVSDSGLFFSPEILENLGKMKVTTNEDMGGSGIGMMKVFKILNETKSSMLINNYKLGKNVFTKRISITFDGMNEYEYKFPEYQMS
ncbi:MAG: ATP-binding protein [Oscillospiraceae bacterium]|nr:ATP-binding protein [Oscillospiraceae bacterium]